MGYLIEVNEAKVFATTQGTEWWAAFRQRFDATRITDVTVSLGGNLCHVVADSRGDADWLAEHMVDMGMPESAVRVRRAEQ